MSPPFDCGTVAVPSVRLNLNESAYGPLPSVSAALRDCLTDVNRYPDFRPDRTRSQIADHLRLPSGQITVGAGATGVALSALEMCRRRAAACGIDSPAIVTAMPTFDGYPILASMVGLRVDAVPLALDGSPDLDALQAAVSADTVAVIVCTPHNPTGAVVDTAELHAFIGALPPGVLAIVDEAYVEFCDNPPDLRALLTINADVLVLRTFSKAYGLAALRVGYGIGARDLVSALHRHEVPFAVGAPAMAAVPVALAAEEQLAERVRAMQTERRRMADMLAAIGCPTLPSQGNFLFVPGPEGVDIGRLLRSCGVATKECATDGIRITVGDRASTDHLIAVLRMTAMTA